MFCFFIYIDIFPGVKNQRGCPSEGWFYFKC